MARWTPNKAPAYMGDPETPEPHQILSRGQLRHQQQQLLAKREGYKNDWARRKAKGQATYVPVKPGSPRRRPGMQPEHTVPLEPRTRLDRLAGGHGPIRQLVADGKPLNKHGATVLAKYH